MIDEPDADMCSSVLPHRLSSDMRDADMVAALFYRTPGRRRCRARPSLDRARRPSREPGVRRAR